MTLALQEARSTNAADARQSSPGSMTTASTPSSSGSVSNHPVPSELDAGVYPSGLANNSIVSSRSPLPHEAYS